MKKKYIFIIAIVIIAILVFKGIDIVRTLKPANKNNDEDQEEQVVEYTNSIPDDAESSTKEDEANSAIQETKNKVVDATKEELEQMKDEISAKGDTSIYQVEEEYDGRKILQVKPQVQFYVAFAGIIKNGKPEENELEKLNKQMPTKTGIWISKQSRDEFMNLLNKNNIDNFSIDEEGYLKSNGSIEDDKIAKKLEKMTNSSNLYIIDIKGSIYERDYITGEITENSFEEIDPNQTIETYTDENKIILELTTNKSKVIQSEEILMDIVQY